MSLNTKLYAFAQQVACLSKFSTKSQPQLALLRISYNNLSELDITTNKMVNTLYAEHNQLNNIDVSNNSSLFDFNIGNNQLTTLDISKNPSMYYLRSTVMRLPAWICRPTNTSIW